MRPLNGERVPGSTLARGKIVALFAVPLALSAVGLLILFPSHFDTLGRQSVERRAASVASVVASAVAAGLEFDDAVGVTEFLDQLRVFSDFTYAEVLRGNGEVYSSWRRASAIDPFGAPVEATGTFIDGDVLHAVAPVEARGGTTGTVRIGLSLEEMQRASKNNFRLAMLAALILVILGLAFAYAISSFVDALRRSEERFALAVRGANDGLWDWDLKDDVIYFSPRWKAIIGCEDGDIDNRSDAWFGRVHPDDLPKLQAAISAHQEGGTAHFENEHRLRHDDGTYRWVLSRGSALRRADGKPYRMAGSASDVTARKLAEEQLIHEAFHDPLTGLPNRALLMDRISRAIRRAERHGDHLIAVLYADLDRFKVLNDSMGHRAGDNVLKAVARRLCECARSSDTVARMGGDEFLLLIDDLVHPGQATRLAERILGALRTPFKVGTQEIYLTASIGIAVEKAVNCDPSNLLRDADTAMYRAKARGHPGYRIFDSQMHRQVRDRLDLEVNLRQALERDELNLVYQPIVSCCAERITTFEALVRWDHGEHGTISPAEFIPVAEETGLIIDLDRWVIRRACKQAARWRRLVPDHPFRVSINLSGKHFRQPHLLHTIAEIMEQTRVSGGDLALEITESAVIRDPEAAIKTLDGLRELGIQIYLDDFGTGYSSLSSLHRFPIDYLKIDRSFISRIDRADNHSCAIVGAIVTLAQSLRMKVVAEGVETLAQMTQVRALGCDFAQGFYCHRPTAGVFCEPLLLGGVSAGQNGQAEQGGVEVHSGGLGVTKVDHDAGAPAIEREPERAAVGHRGTIVGNQYSVK